MQKDDIKKLIEEVLNRMNVRFEEIEVCDVNSGECYKFIIKTPDSGVLIGVKGENLTALNHLLKRMVMKKAPTSLPKFFVDVNNYQDRLFEELKSKVKILSERARSFQTDVELEPMSSYERMMVHSYLEGISDLKSESKGEGKDRRVVIKYIKSV
jgi:spoIIIJ-associated protein